MLKLSASKRAKAVKSLADSQNLGSELLRRGGPSPSDSKSGKSPKMLSDWPLHWVHPLDWSEEPSETSA